MPPRRPKVPKPGDSGKATAVPAAVKSPVPGDQAPAPKAPAVKTPAAKKPGKTSGKTPDKTAPGKTVPGKTAPARKPRAKKSGTGVTGDSGDMKAGFAARAARRSAATLGAAGRRKPEPDERNGSDELRPVPAKAFSGRLMVLAMVMVAVTVLLAPSVRTYLHQRSEISALQATIAREEQAQQDLEAQLERWNDPNYIKQQARERIFLVMPGESRYLVKGEHGVEEVEQQAQDEAGGDLQWVDSLWDSVKRSATAQ